MPTCVPNHETIRTPEAYIFTIAHRPKLPLPPDLSSRAFVGNRGRHLRLDDLNRLTPVDSTIFRIRVNGEPQLNDV